MNIDDQLEALIEQKVAKLHGWTKQRMRRAVLIAGELAECVGKRLCSDDEEAFKLRLASIHLAAHGLVKDGATRAQEVIRDAVMESIAGVLRHV